MIPQPPQPQRPIRWQLFLAIILGCLLVLSIPTTIIVANQSYQSGYTRGHDDGESQGYTRGHYDGESQGFNMEQANWANWQSQNCLDYPFLLLDPNQYMACHR